jgi:viroplasmin and RNaseH domain-containing protein
VPPQVPYRRNTEHIPSLNGGVDTGSAKKAEVKVYTGTKMIGIGTMHKSNSVPIFTDDEAKAISSMRR